MLRLMILIPLLLLTAFLFTSCSKDEAKPTSGEISGTLHLSGQHPPNAKLTLSLFDGAYNAGPPAKYIYINPTDTVIPFTLSDLSFGHYNYLLLGVKDSVRETNYQFIGFYAAGTSTADTVIAHASPFDLSENAPNLTGISIYGNYGFHTEIDTVTTGTISGTIIWRSAFPSGAAKVYAYANFPPMGPPDGRSDVLTLTDSTSTFTLSNVSYGTYAWLGVMLTVSPYSTFGTWGSTDADHALYIPVILSATAPNLTDITIVCYAD